MGAGTGLITNGPPPRGSWAQRLLDNPPLARRARTFSLTIWIMIAAVIVFPPIGLPVLIWLIVRWMWMRERRHLERPKCQRPGYVPTTYDRSPQ